MTINDLYKKAEPFIDTWPADGRSHSEQDMMAAGLAYKELTKKLVEEWPTIRAHIEKLEAENAELRKVSDWYGDGKNHEPFKVKWGMFSVSEVHADGGQRVRDALKGKDGDE